MSQPPIWKTDAGSLGVVPEGRFYRISLSAFDPDFPTDPTKVSYSLISGALPAGVQVNTNGEIAGIPVSVADLKGVPSEVSENTTSKFAIRVIDDENRIADRTFSLTVTGQDVPEFITPAGLIGQYFDGSEITYQFDAHDDDPGDVITITHVGGKLPPGTSINTDGLLTGFIQPVLDLSVSAVAGWDRDNTGFAEFPYDFSTRSISTNYQFTLQVSDGKDIAIRTFDIFVFSRNSMTADSKEITVDSGNVTADSLATRSPYILNHVSDLGSFRHDNFFTYKFNGVDSDGEAVGYSIVSGALPPNLTLDPVTGWISGNLTTVGLTTIQYTFGVQINKVITPAIVSPIYTVSMSVHGDIEASVTWLTPSHLGTIDNGTVSTLSVQAEYAGSVLNYRIADGTASKLPQGLTLLDNGLIIGRTSYKTFSLDGGSTTFGSDFATRLEVAPTTFDLTFTFTAEAYSTSGFVSVTKDFTVLLNREFETPLNVLYCKAMPPIADRNLIDSMLLNRDVIPIKHIYRSQDPNFGTASNIIYLHALGLTPATIEEYFAALSRNHYNKTVTLGELKTARALDDDGNVIYEVVYSQVIDTATNIKGASPLSEIDISAPAVHNGEEVNSVYTNSLENMREQVIDQIGQESKILPRWMLSKQENGEVLGFTPAWVIAYTKPDKSGLIKYNINEFFGTQLNLIDFEIDRYILDSRLSQDWGITVDSDHITVDSPILVSDSLQWKRSVATTFDRLMGISNETLFDNGSCRFTSPVDIYESTDKYDDYIMFPQTKIINNTQ